MDEVNSNTAADLFSSLSIIINSIVSLSLSFVLLLRSDSATGTIDLSYLPWPTIETFDIVNLV